MEKGGAMQSADTVRELYKAIADGDDDRVLEL